MMTEFGSQEHLRWLREHGKAPLPRALNAFWNVIAAAHPECKHGDITPDVALAMENACETAYLAWLGNNQPDETVTVVLTVRAGASEGIDRLLVDNLPTDVVTGVVATYAGATIEDALTY